ncbi:PREDICTED: rust resistance kinase Lr10, partial [Prunus dulcis]
MSGRSLLFAAYTVLLLLLVPSSCSQTSSNNITADNSDCIRSCGNINISSPFRLKGDSKHCGNKSFELSCEAKGNGTTHHAVLYLFSGKYYVQAINYNNFTIRLVDVGVHKIKDNYFSHPLFSLTLFNFSYYSNYTGPLPGYYHRESLMSIVFLSCEIPMHPSHLIVETAPCISGVNNYSSSNSSFSNVTTYSYFIKFPVRRGGPRSYNFGDSCKITLMVMVSPSTEELMTSCKGIYNEIAHGFELSWLHHACKVTCRSGESCRLNRKDNGIYCFQRPLNLIPKAIYLAAKFSFGFCCLTALLIYKWRRRHLSMYENIEDFLRSNNNLMPIRYSYSDIKKMTRGFKDKLGEGGCGSVYKAKLRSGRLLAIKMLSKSKTNNGQDFINEVGTIGRIRHVNVVRLIGFCVDGSKRALKIFEIALGVARGIDYLHQGLDMQILHFDIKPHNILLDENFGLAKLYRLDNSIVSLTAARGTMRYIAPELFYKNIG